MLSAFIVIIIIIITFFYLFYLFAFIPFLFSFYFFFHHFNFLLFYFFRYYNCFFLTEAGLNMDNELTLFVHLQKFTFMCLIWSQGDHALPIFY